MIPNDIVDFLGRASVAIASTRDEDHIPYLHFLSGWSVDDDRRSVTCLVPESFSAGLVERLVPDGRVAMVAEVIGPHETYQLKGRYVAHRPATDADRPVFESCRGRFVGAVHRHLGGRFTDDVLAARFRDPVLALRFRVDEIFVQTPGPAAGRRVFPPEA